MRKNRAGIHENKAYVLESDGDFASRYDDGEFGWNVIDIGLDEIKILNVTHRQNTCEFFLDLHDRRFLTLHTNAEASDAEAAIKKFVKFRGHAFDTAWFHSDLLRKFSKDGGNTFKGFEMAYSNKAMRLLDTDSDIEDLTINMSGSLAEKVENILGDKDDIRRRTAYVKVKVRRGEDNDPLYSVQDDIDRSGYFTIKKGKSVDGHLQLVETCREKYAHIIRDIEKMRIGISESHAKTFTGQAFELEFSRVENLDRFIDNMFNSKEPFRLWGIKTKIQDDYFKVAAVDLHTGSTMNFDVSSDMMRVHVYKGGCGNTVMRLLTNLQIYYDSKTNCAQLADIID